MIEQATGKHIIQKQSIEINFENISDGFALQNRVAELFYEKLLPQMEVLFDEYVGDRYLISFDRLDIDCGILSRQHWEEEWVEQALRNIRKELLGANKVKKDIAIGKEEKLRASFLYFLQKGYLPWNSSVVSLKEIEELFPDPPLQEQLKLLIQSEPKVAARMVNSFSAAFVNKWIGALFQERKERIKNDLSSSDNQLSAQAKRQTKGAISKAEQTPETKQGSNAKKQEAEQEGIYVQNAGLVLLHPFLPELFTTLGLIENKMWKESTSSYTAMIVLEYLLLGNDVYAEFNMPLNKILCGLAIDDVLPAIEPLHPAVKKECDDLLTAVIQHWKVLKNTGIDALRETFLQRSGKLKAVDNGWRLTVEQKAVDILLNHLPWGIGTIRLPWMVEMIYTEWI